MVETLGLHNTSTWQMGDEILRLRCAPAQNDVDFSMDGNRHRSMSQVKECALSENRVQARR
ncbi:MAG: hypothetical protein HPY76_09400 [Anaerolineae bacterium]|nr:hypothetical protein [Anaerolineae bacterium]